ncbi:hypothetical protein MLD38_028236 [Melastoma candidum]|uniref:Uncharacterized protein n=1 Tax=Melastoma candidum TaxID=119954 RepID=A0ACB9N0I2_9MYRT|nr:hypothetical protein MLD38_028236 [Melastoma candidum]
MALSLRHLLLLLPVLALVSLSTLFPSALSQSCSATNSLPFGNAISLYSNCLDLSTLGASLHYTYDPTNSTLSLSFVATPPSSSGWISWALNPNPDPAVAGMIGAQAVIAFKDGAGAVVTKTYNVSSYSSVTESPIAYETWDRTAEVAVGGIMRLSAKFKVGADAVAKGLNQVWQVGGSVVDGAPQMHELKDANKKAKGVLDVVSGTATSGGSGEGARTKRKNIHGILNAVSWGIMLPLGVIIARYLRTFPSADPAWFYLHVFCQFSAYVIGVAGWATGLKLGAESKGIVYYYHRNIGIVLFSVATLQIFALLLRPKKDHKYRFYWNIYHHSLGYAIVALGIVNVFKGINILQPDNKWKHGYIIAIAVLGGIAVLLELVTWAVVLRRKSGKATTKPYGHHNNGQARQPL